MIHMNAAMLEKIKNFKEALADDERVLALLNAEAAMEANEEVMKLAYLKDLAESSYNDALRHYDSSSNEVKVAQKKLFAAKSDLEKHPLVRAYLLAYREVRILYEEINERLFAPFHEHVCEGK
ncbi:MAG: YlbF family regulator [Bacilli bacterium]